MYSSLKHSGAKMMSWAQNDLVSSSSVKLVFLKLHYYSNPSSNKIQEWFNILTTSQTQLFSKIKLIQHNFHVKI